MGGDYDVCHVVPKGGRFRGERGGPISGENKPFLSHVSDLCPDRGETSTKQAGFPPR